MTGAWGQAAMIKPGGSNTQSNQPFPGTGLNILYKVNLILTGSSDSNTKLCQGYPRENPQGLFLLIYLLKSVFI